MGPNNEKYQTGPPASLGIEGFESISTYRQGLLDEREAARQAMRDAMLGLERTHTLDERFFVDTSNNTVYTFDFSLVEDLHVDRTRTVVIDSDQLISLNDLPELLLTNGANGERLEALVIGEERLALSIPTKHARGYVDERGTVLTTQREIYRIGSGPDARYATIETVRHGLPLEAIEHYLTEQGTPSHLIYRALRLVESRRNAMPTGRRS